MAHPFDDLKGDVTGKNGDRKRNTVIAVGTVVLVVLTYFIWRSSKASGAAGSDSTTPAGSDTSGVTGDPGAPTDQSLQSLSNAINSQSSLLAGILGQTAKATKKLATLNKREAKTNATLNHDTHLLHKINKHTAQAKPKHPAKKHPGTMSIVVHKPPAQHKAATKGK